MAPIALIAPITPANGQQLTANGQQPRPKTKILKIQIFIVPLPSEAYLPSVSSSPIAT